MFRTFPIHTNLSLVKNQNSYSRQKFVWSEGNSRADWKWNFDGESIFEGTVNKNVRRIISIHQFLMSWPLLWSHEVRTDMWMCLRKILKEKHWKLAALIHANWLPSCVRVTWQYVNYATFTSPMSVFRQFSMISPMRSSVKGSGILGSNGSF